MFFFVYDISRQNVPSFKWFCTFLYIIKYTRLPNFDVQIWCPISVISNFDSISSSFGFGFFKSSSWKLYDGKKQIRIKFSVYTHTKTHVHKLILFCPFLDDEQTQDGKKTHEPMKPKNIIVNTVVRDWIFNGEEEAITRNRLTKISRYYLKCLHFSGWLRSIISALILILRS
jgi:hypothetical protein